MMDKTTYSLCKISIIFVDDMIIKRKKTKCPHCNEVYSFQEVLFPVVNDFGFLKINCSNCHKIFALNIVNPYESSFDYNSLIIERLVSDQNPHDVIFSNEVVEYNFNLNKTSFEFDYSDNPVYRCINTERSLEIAAKESLVESLDNLITCHTRASDYYLANTCPEFDFFVFSLKINCSCENEHFATFYCPFSKTGQIPREPEEYLLADISNISLIDAISGIFSKNQIMGFLEKLFIRWNLLAHQIIIASPFVGHQWLKRDEKLAIWNWLLSQLDPERSIFITRAKTFSDYNKLLEKEEGLSVDLLKEYNLQNRLIAANIKKNDFHAKFFVGLIGDQAEVLSGSANIVKGPSMENSIFSLLDQNKFEYNYWNKLNIKASLASPIERHWVKAIKDDGHWIACPDKGFNIVPPVIQ